MSTAAQLREDAYASAMRLTQSLQLPTGCALAATGSFARRAMTPFSDLDLILLHPDDTELPEEVVSEVWYPIWDAKYRLDYAVRTPHEFGAIAGSDPAAGFAQLDLAFVAGDKQLVDSTRAQVYASWRRLLQSNFDAFVELAIARWRRSGTLATMTHPDIKNGRGGLRDIQFLRALALGNLADAPALEEEQGLLLDVRTLLHVTARRHRDILDPEFAAEIAHEMGFADRYELSAAVVTSAAAVDRAVERALATARGVVAKRSHNRTRKPLDIGVVDVGGEIRLARTADLDEPWLLLRVAAAAARSGRSVPAHVWEQLRELPDLPQRWPAGATDAFFSLLSSPLNTPRLIQEMDAHGLWERVVPEWEHIRGLLPRERTHSHTVDYHSILTVARCAEARTSVARPDLLLLVGLYHDIGKGYGRPHELVGAEMVACAAAKLGLDLADRSRVQTVVAEHTTLARIVSRTDPYSDEARDELLEAVRYDYLTLALLVVLARTDAESTGPGVWNRRLENGIEAVSARAFAQLEALSPVRPLVAVDRDIGLRHNPEDDSFTVLWRGSYQREAVRPLALIAALGWNILSSRLVRTEEGYAGEFDIRALHGAIDLATVEERLVQSYKSGTYTVLPDFVPGPATAMWTRGVFELRIDDYPGTLGHVLALLPECEWLSTTTPGATMVLHAVPLGDVPRATLVRNVTQALVNG
ncbi:[protein-PII] uridylyltransferase [Corynebacterium guaraldiae]|uniref:[protein-PII] uridylyltransferase n=1 Tax=Corynebacterium guaraldiae TaxID=3051103 RepID=A0ABY3CV87_9CORY|nr:[protein-PII] uridylyltransferase [Corynebacterium guaraldiae]TRX49903.1 [protein-PII] uridylyltransferase [Corynebacterium guaraldiae]TRX55369.1 [protein-PII] uridylyltransferase [Corynebacterium guaraldiae]